MLTKTVEVKAFYSRFSTVKFYCVLPLVINMTTLWPAHHLKKEKKKKTYCSSLAVCIIYALTKHVFCLYLGFCIVI